MDRLLIETDQADLADNGGTLERLLYGGCGDIDTIEQAAAKADPVEIVRVLDCPIPFHESTPHRGRVEARLSAYAPGEFIDRSLDELVRIRDGATPPAEPLPGE